MDSAFGVCDASALSRTDSSLPTERSHPTSVGANIVSAAAGVCKASICPETCASAAVVFSSGVSSSLVANESTHLYQPGTDNTGLLARG